MTHASATLSKRAPDNGVELATFLRGATAQAHADLEASLDLLGQVHDRQTFLGVLDRFFGFHAVWEVAIAHRPHLAAFHGPRARLPHLRRDLSALGRTNDEIRSLPLCLAAHHLVDDADEAVGSIYVMEGSTLGGQVIGRAIAEAGWRPAGGLTYFQPHGQRTGEMWRSFRRWADDSGADPDKAAVGANRTFRLLQDWVAA